MSSSARFLANCSCVIKPSSSIPLSCLIIAIDDSGDDDDDGRDLGVLRDDARGLTSRGCGAKSA